MMNINLYMISSPLQYISCSCICRSNKGADSINIFLIEGDISISEILLPVYDEIIEVQRCHPKTSNYVENIACNIDEIKKIVTKYQFSTLTLLVSDLYWVLNNAIYTVLQKEYPNQFQCCLFDEGAAAYCRQTLSFRDRLASYYYKYKLALKGIKYTTLSKRKHENNNHKIKKIYLYEPSYTNVAKRLKKVEKINIDFLSEMRNIEIPAMEEGSLLFLSQPLRIYGCGLLVDEIYEKLFEYCAKKNINKVYIKPHHFDTPSCLLHLSHTYEFSIFDFNYPIELLADVLNCSCVVSVTSSALINLPLFNYKGKILSLGIDILKKNIYWRARVQSVGKMFSKLGIEKIN